MPRTRWTTWAISGAFVLWVVLLVAGDAALLRTTFTQGHAAAAPRDWPGAPDATGVDLAAEGHTLLAFAHPQCPCTRATLRELLRLQTDAPAPLQMVIIFTGGGGEADAWESTTNVRTARAIPGARIVMDAGGDLMRRFGALTSGQALIYDSAGRLQFSGGVTIARAHEGDSPGRAAALAILAGAAPATTSISVFGCPLTERNTLASGGGSRE